MAFKIPVEEEVCFRCVDLYSIVNKKVAYIY